MASGKSKIPDDFLIGTGSSAYQIEGAWKADKKAPSIWDTFFHTEKLQETPTLGKQLSPTENDRFYKGIPTFYSETSTTYINGDIACDSYNKIDEDVNNLVDLKVNTYRFSVCWPRVLPTCNDQEPNPAGVKYYETLINKLIAKKITPVVTIYHWDLPDTLQEIGGWSNPNIIEYFVNYADFLFRTFGSQVKYWTTINEPRILSNGYGMKGMAPISVGDSFNGIADYMAIRNLLLAHAAVYRMYKAKYFAEQRGKISSLCFDTSGYFPINPDLKEDREAVKKAYDFTIGFYAQPLKDGKFPQSVIDGIAETNNIENISLTRLVQFNEKEQEQLRGSYDFIAFNYYESSKVTPMKKTDYNDKTTLKDRDIGVKFDKDITTEEIFKGFTEVVHWFNKEFDKPKIFIAENGYAGTYNVDGTEKKIEYHRGIWTEIENAIKEDKIDIIGYCVWSFMDSLEWSFGYFKYQFGIYKVDFEDPKRPRSKKRSFEFFQNLFESKSLPPIKSYK